MIKKLTRFEVADIRAVAQRTSALRRKRASVWNRIVRLNDELDELDHIISRWEEPILGITEGLSAVDAMKRIRRNYLVFDGPECDGTPSSVEDRLNNGGDDCPDGCAVSEENADFGDNAVDE